MIVHFVINNKGGTMFQLLTLLSGVPSQYLLHTPESDYI